MRCLLYVKKAADIYKQLARAVRITWGLNGEIVRPIYVAVIEPIVLYAASAWSPAAEKLMTIRQLGSLQRGFAIKLYQAYRTVSLISTLVLSSVLLLDPVQEAATLFKITKYQDFVSYFFLFFLLLYLINWVLPIIIVVSNKLINKIHFRRLGYRTMKLHYIFSERIRSKLFLTGYNYVINWTITYTKSYCDSEGNLVVF